ncbi:MAG: HEPN domain-containing protein [Saprospiraceae bacterium]
MKHELEVILRNAEDCLSDAEFNLKHDRLRAAANRAYYCIFDCITALLHTKGVYSKTHQGAHTQFRLFFVKTKVMSISLDEVLIAVFDLRQSCDYDFEFDPNVGDVAAAVNGAREFFEATKAFLSNT